MEGKADTVNQMVKQTADEMSHLHAKKKARAGFDLVRRAQKKNADEATVGGDMVSVWVAALWLGSGECLGQSGGLHLGV